MQLQSVSRNKADILQDLRAKMLAECEPDIQETFAGQHFTVEPLLIQLIREVRALTALLLEDTRP
jgi:hypothetical protein